MARPTQKFERKTNASLDVTIFTFPGSGVLLDADFEPIFKILDPSDIVVFTGTGVHISLGVYEATWPISATDILSNEWNIQWTVTLSTVEFVVEEFFEITEDASPPIGTVIIDSVWLDQIKKVLAFPSVGTILLTDLEIKGLCVYHALHDYFKRYPLKRRELHSINNTLILDWPNDIECIGVLDVRVVNKLGKGQGEGDFWRIIRHQQTYGRNVVGTRGRFGTKFAFGSILAQIGEQEQLLYSESNKATFKHYINYEDKKLEVYSETSADLAVTWAYWEANFNKVKFTKQFDVIRLAQSYLLQHLADTTGIINANLDQEVDSDTLATKAKDLRDEVLERWNEEPIFFVARGA